MSDPGQPLQSTEWWRQNWLSSAELLMIGAAILVGAGTGFGAVIFIWLLGRINALGLWVQALLGGTTGLILTMLVAGLTVGWLIERWAAEAKGHGVPEVIEAVALRGGRIRARVAVAKIVASAMTIGAGGSAGREGPIVQVGSALGATLGQFLRLTDERLRTLVACGAAAGIAATFNAPIAGSIFALEVILGRFTVRYFGAVVLSAVSGSIVSRAFLSNRPAFDVPAYPLHHLLELPLYVILSALAALLAVLFIQVLYAAEGVFDRWPVPLPIRTAVGMLLTALVALPLSGRQVLGPGLEFIGEALAGDFAIPLGLLLALTLLKLLATTATLGAGNSGGVFAPSLFMGATLGGLLGNVAHQLWPAIVVDPGAYAIVGMAATFSGAARAPITAILIVFEMSGDYQLILPLMLATVLATLIAERLFADSIYTLKLTRRGIRLLGGRDEVVLAGVPVGEVMEQNLETVTADLTLGELAHRLSHSHHHGFPLLDEAGKLVGIVTLNDLDHAVAAGLPRHTPVKRIATPRSQLITIFPDEPIGRALQGMARRDFGRLPVVAREDPDRLLGLIRRVDIVNAYNAALTRRAELQHQTKQLQLQNVDGTRFIELLVGPADPVLGRSVKELARELPEDCVLVAIRRQGQLLLPHGYTRLQAGDQVTAFVTLQEEGRLRTCFHGPGAGDETPPP